jgi:hypothetical protein
MLFPCQTLLTRHLAIIPPSQPPANTGGSTFADSGIYSGTVESPTEQASDLVFHANLEAVPEPSTSTSTLLGLGGITLILR